MPNDELIGLAAQIQAAPGTYALLLGAGVSVPAGIKSGWHVLEDLCRKIALANGAHTANPTDWYQTQYGREANYSTVLEQLAPTPAGRNALVRTYIDASDDEREDGLKAPTKAHRAIARMVRRGWIKMIMTLNFDDLLERALRDEGISPDVITRAEDIGTTRPFVHSNCTVIKLHGDFTDLTSLNTGSELGAYTTKLQNLLERVLEDFGLVTCGWSGQWDTALIEAVKQASSPYQLYFTSPGSPGPNAQSMLEARGGTHIQISSADDAFEELEQITEAIEMLKVNPPQTLELAVAMTKRYLSQPKYRLAHRDLLLKESGRVLEALRDQNRFPRNSEVEFTDALLSARWRELASLTLPLAGMLAVTTAFGNPEHQDAVQNSLEHLGASLEMWRQGISPKLTASLTLPFVLAVYAAGLGAVLAKNSEGLIATIVAPQLANKKSILYDFHPDIPFEFYCLEMTSSNFQWNVYDAGVAMGGGPDRNENVLLDFLRPALDLLGYPEQRLLEALPALSYYRQILAFRKTGDESNEAISEAAHDRASTSISTIPASICKMDARRGYPNLRQVIGKIRLEGDNHWVFKAIWESNLTWLLWTFDNWADHTRETFGRSGFSSIPRFEDITPTKD